MDLRHVELKKVVWTGAKTNDEGEEKEPPKIVLTLEIADPATTEIKELIDFARSGPTRWSIDSVQRSFSGA